MPISGNNYTLTPNEKIDGSTLPSSVNTIVGAGGNVVTLGPDQSYQDGPGNNTINFVAYNNETLNYWKATQPVNINLQTGIVSNNGLGGTDTLKGLQYLGYINLGDSNANVIGGQYQMHYGVNNGNTTTTGGSTGNDFIEFYNPISNYTYKVNSNGSITFTNKFTGSTTNTTNIKYFDFNYGANSTLAQATIDFSNISNPITYQVTTDYTNINLGSIFKYKLSTTNLAPGSIVKYSIGGFTQSQLQNGETSGSVTLDQNGQATITVQTINTGSISGKYAGINLIFGNTGTWTPWFNLYPAGSIKASAPQINAGAVEVFTISTQLPAGGKFEYAISGISLSDTTLSSLTGTLVADSNGNATLTVPILSQKSFQGDKKLMLSAGGSTSSVSVIDTASKDPNTYYGTGGDDNIDGSKLASSIKTINPGSGNDTIYLAGNQAYEANYGNKTIYSLSGNGGVGFWNAIQPVNINLTTGVVANNGFGGQDKISGISLIMTGYSDSTIVGSKGNDQFTINGGNNNITGGGGNDRALYYQTTSNQCVLSLRPDKGINVIDNKTNTQDVLYGITTIQFDDKSIATSSITAAPVITVFDTFDGTYLSIPQVVVGATSYTNVVVTVKSVVTIGSGNPNNSFDVYNSGNNQLSIPSVKVGTTMYSNCVITVGSVISINGVLVNPTPTPSSPSSGSNTGGTPTPTGPVVTLTSTTPANKSTNVQPTADIVFKFSENIVPVSGKISLIEPTVLKSTEF